MNARHSASFSQPLPSICGTQHSIISSIVHSYVNSPSVKHHLQYFSFSPPSRFVPITQSSVSGMPQLWHTSVCGFPRSVLIETRNSFEMRCNVSRFGVVSPRSHRETACRVTNSRYAISFWESPSLWRSAEKICENAMLPPPDTSIIEAGRSAVKQRAVSPSPYAGLKAASPNSGYARACRFIKRNTAPLNAPTCKSIVFAPRTRVSLFAAASSALPVARLKAQFPRMSHSLRAQHV